MNKAIIAVFLTVFTTICLAGAIPCVKKAFGPENFVTAMPIIYFSFE